MRKEVRGWKYLIAERDTGEYKEVRETEFFEKLRYQIEQYCNCRYLFDLWLDIKYCDSTICGYECAAPEALKLVLPGKYEIEWSDYRSEIYARVLDELYSTGSCYIFAKGRNIDGMEFVLEPGEEVAGQHEEGEEAGE